MTTGAGGNGAAGPASVAGGAGAFCARREIDPAALFRLRHRAADRRDLQGARGRSTIVEDRRLVNIGFAISQTLFRTADQGRLAEFFRWIDLGPGEQIGGAELLAYFRVWHVGAAQKRAAEEVDPAVRERMRALGY